MKKPRIILDSKLERNIKSLLLESYFNFISILIYY